MESYKQRWEIESELGKGGQGTVYRVLDTKMVMPREELRERFKTALRELGGISYADRDQPKFDEFVAALNDVLNREKTEYRGALKVLHNSTDARDPLLADERMVREIAAMQELTHPNLVEILDSKPADRWYVSRFYSGGVLINKLD